MFAFFVSIFLVGILNVNAACNNQELNKLANNVTANFEEAPKDYVMHYNIKFNNLNDKLYIVLTNTFDDTKTTIYPDKFVNGSAIYFTDVTSLKVTYTGVIYSNTDACKHQPLNTVTYTSPIYNSFYYDPVCAQLPGAAVCQRYLEKLPSLDEFYESTTKYAENPSAEAGKELVTNPYHKKDECKDADNFEYCNKEVVNVPTEEEFDTALEKYENIELTTDEISEEEERKMGIGESITVFDDAPKSTFWIAMGVVAIVTIIIVVVVIRKKRRKRETIVGEMK